MRRVIQDHLEDPIAKILLRGEAKRRDTICVGDSGEISVEKAKVL